MKAMPGKGQKKPGAAEAGAGPEELNLDGIEGLESLHDEQGSSIPKKVELDIDDMILEEESEGPTDTEIPETPPEPQAETAARPEPEANQPEEPKKKFSRIKLAIMVLAVIIPIAGLAVGGFLFMTSGTPEEQTPAGSAFLPTTFEMTPFLVNYPPPGNRLVSEIWISVTVRDENARRDFDSRLTTIRDLVYRYLQGQGPLDPDDPAVGNQMAVPLTSLLNKSIMADKIKRIVIMKIKPV